jgi:hypothetical protein
MSSKNEYCDCGECVACIESYLHKTIPPKVIKMFEKVHDARTKQLQVEVERLRELANRERGGHWKCGRCKTPHQFILKPNGTCKSWQLEF